MTPANKLLPIMLAGSHARPDWLIDREKFARVVSPRTGGAAQLRARLRQEISAAQYRFSAN